METHLQSSPKRTLSERLLAQIHKSGSAQRYAIIFTIGILIVLAESVIESGLSLRILISELPHALSHVVVYGLALGVTLRYGTLSHRASHRLRVVLASLFMIIGASAFFGETQVTHVITHTTGIAGILYLFLAFWAAVGSYVQYKIAHSSLFGSEHTVLCVAVGWHAVLDTFKNGMLFVVCLLALTGWVPSIASFIDTWTNLLFAGSLVISGIFLLFIHPSHSHDQEPHHHS